MGDAIKFTVGYDEACVRFWWTMRGFWDLADVAALEAAMRAALTPLGAPPFHFDSLCDARRFPVQSRDVVAALSAIERAGAAIREGRAAIVVGSMLNKLQAQRIFSPDVRIFMTMQDAEDWLDGRAP